jgi:hypothetical protein
MLVSTKQISVKPVWLDRAFQYISNNIKFAKFGQAKQILLNFENGASIEFKLKLKIQF